MPPVQSFRRPARPGGQPAYAWVVLFSLALALRLAWAWLAPGPDSPPGSAAATVDTLAWNLARGEGFSLGPSPETRPTASLPPIDPWLTSLVYRAAGHHPWVAMLARCAIGALVPLLLAGFGAALFGEPIGRWSGWLAAFHPLLIVSAAEPLGGTTLSAALLLALWLSAEWVRTPRAGRALGVGLASGAAALAHASGLALPAVVAAWAWRPLGWRWAVRDARAS